MGMEYLNIMENKVKVSDYLSSIGIEYVYFDFLNSWRLLIKVGFSGKFGLI